MAEVIQVLERRYGVVPSLFKQKGHLFRVDAVKECWTEMTTERVRYHFQVRSGQQWYRLSEDRSTGNWTAQKNV